MTSISLRHLRRRSRRGFGAFIAILLLLLVAATLPMIASVFAADAKRTRSQADDAQLRQMLIAGAVFAKGQATAEPQPEMHVSTRPAIIEVPLPQELTDADAKLSCSLDRVDADHAKATVRARLGKRSMEQTITFERRAADRAWHAVVATLNHD